jgi:hypothetical protein
MKSDFFLPLIIRIKNGYEYQCMLSKVSILPNIERAVPILKESIQGHFCKS